MLTFNFLLQKRITHLYNSLGRVPFLILNQEHTLHYIQTTQDTKRLILGGSQ